MLWQRGESKAGDVMEQLQRPLAYTTVMTTLDRLFKKGMLKRRKLERAFSYIPRLSRRQWNARLLASSVNELLSAPPPCLALLMSSLVDMAGNEHRELLDHLERKIQQKRAELKRREEA